MKAELYHLWAIGGEGYKEVMKELPLDKAGLHVIFMPSIKQFRDKKVRILNGSHTGMVPIALQMGCETVMDAFNTPAIERFINEMVAEEVIPMIEEDQEGPGGAETVRRGDPRTLLQPLHQAPAAFDLAQFAVEVGGAQLSDREGQLVQGREAGRARVLHLRGFEPDDTKEFVDYIRQNWNSEDLEGTIAKIVRESGIFTVDFSEVPGFVEAVAGYVGDIESLGMKGALDKFLNK